MSHDDLCKRAMVWLRNNRRCDPVFNNIASCSEIPDAIGWSSSYKHRGSIVVECKTSVADFHADKWKYIGYKHPQFGSIYPSTRYGGARQFEKDGYTRVDFPCMGDYRFFMCLSGLISVELVEKYRPDHGLLWVDGRKVKIAKEAPRRESPDLRSEIRYLRFAIINNKTPFESPAEDQPEQMTLEGQ